MHACYRDPEGQLTVFRAIHFHPPHTSDLFISQIQYLIRSIFEAYIVVYNTVS